MFRRPAPRPKNGRWSSRPIDRFIMARLEREGLEPSPRATKRTLIRRVTFDLTGLVWPDGRLELTTNGPPASLACSPAVGVQYHGHIDEASFEARGETTLRCPDGDYAVSYRLEGTRVRT